MPLMFGSTPIGAIYHGSTAIGRVYHDSTLVWEKAGGGGTPAPAPTYIGRADFANAGASSVAFPTIAAGDVCMAAVETSDQAMPTPTGASFNLIGNVASGGTTRLTLFWALLAGTETTFSYGDSGDHQIGQLYIIRGCTLPGGSPVHAINSASGLTTGSSIVIPGFTTTEDNCLVMGFVAEDNFGGNVAAFANSDLTGATTINGFGNSAGNNGQVGAGYGTKASAGTVGNMTANRGAGQNWAGYQIALR